MTAGRSIVAALLSLAPLPLRAHSELRGSIPADHARLASSPTEFRLQFNEAVQVTLLRLLDASGRSLALRREGGSAPAAEIQATPAAPLAPGSYRLDWRAISADGHPIGGSVRFSIDAAR